jgi:hypothetical protein
VTVQAEAVCAQCGGPFTRDPGQRRYCGQACALAAGRDRQAERQAQRIRPATERWPSPPELPPPPDFSQGWCTRVKPGMRSIWTSSVPAERRAAQYMCSSCPVREPCTAWSLSLPASDPSVYGGLSHHERIKRRRAWLLAIAAQVRNPR